MPDSKTPLHLDESEASLALHALRFYMNAKGAEVSSKTHGLEARLDDYLSGTTFEVQQVENVASILGARGGAKGGVSTSEAKRAAAAANGAKGGRPPRPNLYIKFSKSVWLEPDPKLLNELYKLAGSNSWLPDECGGETEGPYVRMHVREVGSQLKKLLTASENVWEWDETGLYRYCAEHKTDLCVAMTAAEKIGAACLTCSKPAFWVY